MTPEDIAPLAGALAAQIERLAQAAYQRTLALIEEGVEPRRAVELVLESFAGQYAGALSAAYSAALVRRVTPGDILAIAVGDVTLSERLYTHARQTGQEVAAIVRQHAQGLQQSRALALQLYDGYAPQDGIKRPLEGAARAQLPKALRELTREPGPRQELQALYTQMQQQAARLKSEALKAGYLETLKAWQDGAGREVLAKRLWVAEREKTRFMATRIAQTELARAHQAQVAGEFMRDERLEVVEVRLNPRHPLPDICDLHARADMFGLGPGIYPKGRAPVPPWHPFCWCRLSSRPDLSAQLARERPGAVRAYLKSLEPAEAARVLGSRERLDAVMNGADWEAVTQAGVRAEYRLQRLDGMVAPSARVPAGGAGSAVAFVERAIGNPREKQKALVLSSVSAAAIERADALGIDLRGKSLALNHDGVLHAFKGHGGPNERLRGQIPIEPSDMSLFDRIFNEAALVHGIPPVARDKTPMLAGQVVIDGVLYVFAAKVRRLHVVPQTLFKRAYK